VLERAWIVAGIEYQHPFKITQPLFLYFTFSSG